MHTIYMQKYVHEQGCKVRPSGGQIKQEIMKL